VCTIYDSNAPAQANVINTLIYLTWLLDYRWGVEIKPNIYITYR